MKLKNKIKNASTLGIENFVRMISGVFIFWLVLENFGGQQLALLATSIGFFTILHFLSRGGLDGNIVPIMLANAESAEKKISNAIVIRLALYLAILMSLLVLLILTNILDFKFGPNFSLEIIIILFFSSAFLPFDLIIFKYQAEQEAYKISIYRTGVMLAFALLKILAVIFGSSVYTLVPIYFLENTTLGLVYILVYAKNFTVLKLFSKVNREVWLLVTKSWPLLVSGLVSVINTKVDFFVVGALVESETSGIYAFSSRVFEGCIVLGTISSILLYPAIIKLSEVHDKSLGIMEKNYPIVIILFLLGLLPFSFFLMIPESLGVYILSDNWAEFSGILTFHLLALPFVMIAMYSSRFYVAGGNQMIWMLLMLLTLSVNFVFSRIMFFSLGSSFVALSPVISFALLAFFLDFLTKEGRSIAKAKWALST